MKQRGQALSEALLGMLVLAPLLILVPYFGKYLDVKHTALDAHRYLVWERTVASATGEWGAGENRRSAADLDVEVRRLFLGDPRAPIGPNNAAVEANVLWEDHQGGNLVPLDEVTIRVDLDDDPFPYGVTGTFLGKPDSASLVTALAYDGLPLLNELDGLSDLLGGALDFNLGLNEEGFAEAEVTLPALALPEFVRAGMSQVATPSAERLRFSATGAILSDAWVPGSESDYVDRLDGLITDEIVAALVLPGTFTFGFFPLFKEGLDGQNPKLETDSRVLPPRYLDTEE